MTAAPTAPRTEASPVTVYTNARAFTGRAAAPLCEAFAVQGERFLAAGTEAAVLRVAGTDAPRVDLAGAFVMPGINEGHSHMLMLGEALDKVQLRDCDTVAQVQERLRAARAANPDAERILGVSWRFDIFADGQLPTADLLDEIIPDVPVILDANDLHSIWVNTPALAAMGVTDDTPDPVGGDIVRAADGTATGFLRETAAIQFGWGYLERVATDSDRDRFLDNAFAAYLAAGVTATTDMSWGEAELATYGRRLRRDGRLPVTVDGYWLLTPSDDLAADLAQLDRVAEVRDALRAEFGDEWLRLAGVKFISDGVIDACTAAMRQPFANGAQPPTIWPREHAIAVAVAADRLGLQLAVHAIGDDASTLAVEMFTACARENGVDPERRPRVEHLEYVAEDTIANLAALDATASMQPVHCDPAVIDNWMAVLGDDRAEHGFPWHRFREAGARLALGTDAPTAPHVAVHNLFIALTAGSALDPARSPYHPERVFGVADALEAMTAAAADAAMRGGRIGQIRAGYRADFIVLTADPFVDDPRTLLGAEVASAWVAGRHVPAAGEAG